MPTFQFIWRFKRATQVEQLNALLTEFMLQFEVLSFAFTFYLQYPTSKGQIQYDYASNPLRAWHRHYLTNHYEDSDQTLQWSKQILEPIHWQIETQEKKARTPKERRLRQESKAFGIDRGICFPIHGPSDDFAVLVIHQRVGETCLQQIESYLHEFHIVGYYYYTQLKKILRKKKSKVTHTKLTPREYQCLKLTRDNFLAKDIAQLINITPRTVHFHIQNAIKKLGVKNKYQAASKCSDDFKWPYEIL